VKRTPYYVEWMDTAKTGDDHPNPKGLQPVRRHTVGWLVKKNKRYILLAMDRTKWPEGNTEYEHGFAIARRVVLRHGKLRRGTR
jgi:hypothetical protein